MPEENKLWTRNFILMCFANLLMSVAFYFLIPTLPIFLEEVLHAPKSKIGIIFASYTLAALIIRPFAGFAVDNYGRNIIYLISFFVFSLIFGSFAAVVTLLQMLLLRFAHGLAWGVTTTSAATAIVDIIPAKRRGEGLGYYGVSMTIALAIGPYLGTLIAGKSHFDLMFLVAAIISFVGFLMALQVKFPKHHSSNENKRLEWSKLIETSSVPVSLIILLVCVSYGGVVIFVSLYAKEIHIENSGIFFLIYAIGLALTRLTSGKIFDKNGPALISFFGLVLLISGLIILSFLKNHFGFYSSALLIGAGFGIVFPIFQAMVNQIVDIKKRGIANSTFFTAVDLGIGFGSVAAGFIADKLSLTYAFYFCTLVVILAAFLFFIYTLPVYKARVLSDTDNTE